MQLLFSKEIYPKIVLLKASYAFTDKAYIHLDADEKNYIVRLEMKSKDCVVSEQEFLNEMLCQCTRNEINKQTQKIRCLLLARALASTVIEEPSDEGQEIVDLDVDEAEILSDWFDKNDSND